MKFLGKIAESLDLVKGFEQKVLKDYSVILNLSEDEKTKLKSLSTYNILLLPSILKIWSKSEPSLVSSTGNGASNIKWLINQVDNDNFISLRDVFSSLEARGELNAVHFAMFASRMNALNASDKNSFLTILITLMKVKVGSYGYIKFDVLLGLPYSKDKFDALSSIVSVLSRYTSYLQIHVMNIFEQSLECLKCVNNILMILQNNENLLGPFTVRELMTEILHQNEEKWPAPFHSQSRLAMTEQFMRSLEHSQMMDKDNVLLFNTLISLFDNSFIKANRTFLIDEFSISRPSELIDYIDTLARNGCLTQDKLQELARPLGDFDQFSKASDSIYNAPVKKGIR